MFFIPNLAGATEVFDFMTAVVNSYQSAEIAGSRAKNNDSRELVTQMKDIIVFNNELSTGAQFMKPFLTSKNQLIKESPESFFTIYSSIIQSNRNLLGDLETILNNPEAAASREGTVLRKFSEHMAANEELWRMLLYATTLSTYTLIDQNRVENGKFKFLTITAKERESLKNQLIEVFGAGIKSGPKGGQLPLKALPRYFTHFLIKVGYLLILNKIGNI